MHGHTSFEIRIKGNDDNVKAVNAIIKDIITDEDFDEGSEIEIEETYKCVGLEEITNMAHLAGLGAVLMAKRRRREEA